MYKNFEVELDIKDPAKWKDSHLTADAINIKENGIFLLNTDSWHLTTEDLNMLGLSVKDDALDLQGKSLYRYPKLSLPRQKVDLLKGSYDVKITRDQDKADIHVVSKKLIESLIEFKWTASHTKRQFYAVMIDLRENNLISEEFIAEVRKILEESDSSDYFRLNVPYTYRSLTPAQEKLISNCEGIIQNHQKLNKQRSAVVEKDKNVEIYKSLSTTSAQIVLDTEVNKKISESLTTLTEDDYKNLLNQINSANIEDRTLALELMANSNYEEGFDILAAIYFFNFDKCKWTNHWNTVNIKGFRNRFKVFEGGCQESHGHTYSRFIKHLIREEKLTEFIVNLCREKVHKKVLPAAGILGDQGFVIKLEDIHIYDKYKDKIKVDNVSNEYICT
tara:strand:- start:594 stop:1763 length:1170 start_codon:yes stop_codon:yes gene_type:complete